MSDENTPQQPDEQSQGLTPLTNVDDLIAEILSGKWGRGQRRIQRLREAGHDPDLVMAAYKEVINRS